MGVRCCRMGTTAIGEGLSIRFIRRAQPQRSPTDLRSRREHMNYLRAESTAVDQQQPDAKPARSAAKLRRRRAALPRSNSREHSLKHTEARLPVSECGRNANGGHCECSLTQCAGIRYFAA